MRLTGKKLTAMVNELFKKYEIEDYVATKIVSTRYSSEQLQGGAAKIHVHFESVDPNAKNNDDYTNFFYGFYSIKEYQEHLEKGFRLALTWDGRHNLRTMTNLELNLLKK